MVYRLLLGLGGKGRYRILDHNDDRLRMVALLLTNGRVRKTISVWLSQMLYMGQEVSTTLTQPTISVELIFSEPDALTLKFHELGTAIYLQTDIERSTLQQLIDTFEMLLGKEVEQMELTREADTFVLHEVA